MDLAYYNWKRYAEIIYCEIIYCVHFFLFFISLMHFLRVSTIYTATYHHNYGQTWKDEILVTKDSGQCSTIIAEQDRENPFCGQLTRMQKLYWIKNYMYGYSFSRSSEFSSCINGEMFWNGSKISTASCQKTPVTRYIKFQAEY